MNEGKRTSEENVTQIYFPFLHKQCKLYRLDSGGYSPKKPEQNNFLLFLER
jgi:hypothetical protein